MDERTTLRYVDELQGQIDQLRRIIKGGGGGSSVVINPEGAATADLEKIKSGDTIYGLNYNKNANRPQVNSNLLTGNKTSKQLNIAESMTEAEYAALSSKNEHEIYFLQEHASVVTETEDNFTIEWEAYSDPAYVATLSYVPSDQDVTSITGVTCDTDSIEIVTFELDHHGEVSVTIGCEDPSEVPDTVEFTFTFIQPAGGTRIVKNGVDFGADTFTTAPIKIGKWIDGKDLYRQIISASEITADSSSSALVENVSFFATEFISCTDDVTSHTFSPGTYSTYTIAGAGTDYCYVYNDSGSLKILNANRVNTMSAIACVIYTKTTP